MCDVLYTKPPPAQREDSDDSDPEFEGFTDEGEEDSDDDEEDGVLDVDDVEEDPGELDIDTLNLVKKVQKLCKKFRKSNVENDALQEEVRALFGKELQLKIDCKTRWHTVLSMLVRFLKIRYERQNFFSKKFVQFE